MKKKLIGVTIIAAMAVAAGWNFNQTKNEASTSDITLDNLEAIAQGRGNFPACQKTEKSDGDKRTIPFCVKGECKQVSQVPYKLDVNSCSEDPK